MITTIKNIAEVQMGYSFRVRLEACTGDGVRVIQMKDLLDDNTVDCSRLAMIDKPEIKEHHLVQKGDLIFRSRGQVATSAVLLEDIGNAIVAAPLLRIRISKPDKILPEYLNWYISQKDAQIFLTSRAKGTALKMISKNTIENLEVPLPSIAKQSKIIELVHLEEEEQRILNTLAQKRRQYLAITLTNLAKGE